MAGISRQPLARKGNGFAVSFHQFVHHFIHFTDPWMAGKSLQLISRARGGLQRRLRAAAILAGFLDRSRRSRRVPACENLIWTLGGAQLCLCPHVSRWTVQPIAPCLASRRASRPKTACRALVPRGSKTLRPKGRPFREVWSAG